jgi:CheY-like chemotaxis protein
VTLKESADGQQLVVIACNDKGAGLSKANLQLLFGEGVQFNANKLQAGGGSGLGLFITKGIVLLHKDANIWAESEGEGKGCTFFVELPLLTTSRSVYCEGDNDGDNNSLASLEDEKQEDSIGPLIGRNDNVSVRSPGPSVVFKPRVLIVDDSLMNRRMLARMLEAEGFECHQAVDGLAAVAYINRAVLRRTLGVRQSSSVKVRAVPSTMSNRYLTAGTHHTGAPVAGSVSGAAEAAAGSGEGEDNSLRSTSSEVSERPNGADVILMDSNMPKMNGPDAVVEIRKLGFTFPIFGVTGDDDHASFTRAGVDGVMMKPVKADDLVKSIKAALHKAVGRAAMDKHVKLPIRQQSVVGLLAPRRISTPAPTVGDEHLASLEKWLKGQATAKK